MLPAASPRGGCFSSTLAGGFAPPAFFVSSPEPLEQRRRLAGGERPPDHGAWDLARGSRVELVRLDERAGETVDRRLDLGKDHRLVLADHHPALAIELVNDPEQRHQVAVCTAINVANLIRAVLSRAHGRDWMESGFA